MKDIVAHCEVVGKVLTQLGTEEPCLAILSPDVGSSTKALEFRGKFPERYICTGISEQNTIGMAAGLAYMGWTPVVVGYAMFIGGKAWEPFRNSVCYPGLNVKMIATHGGVNVGEDGVTHQAIEDIAIMRAIPGLTVLAPCDAGEVLPLMRLALTIKGPVYLRLERQKLPIISTGNTEYTSQGSAVLRDGSDATIMAVGGMVHQALQAADLLSSDGLEARVINMYSIKPIDRRAIYQAAEETRCIVTAEDHNVVGGLGSAVAETLIRKKPIPMEMIGIQDTFAESGNANKLYEKYCLTPEHIADSVRSCINSL